MCGQLLILINFNAQIPISWHFIERMPWIALMQSFDELRGCGDCFGTAGYAFNIAKVEEKPRRFAVERRNREDQRRPYPFRLAGLNSSDIEQICTDRKSLYRNVQSDKYARDTAFDLRPVIWQICRCFLHIVAECYTGSYKLLIL